ncbi:hypothetical protein [Streptomyces sp. NPDC056227]|uniref:hypothetical protein n=1 Tax=Streptomyces sp. NPDC056227 TaxID=3345753 RepID=UPI0035D8D4DA
MASALAFSVAAPAAQAAPQVPAKTTASKAVPNSWCDWHPGACGWQPRPTTYLPTYPTYPAYPPTFYPTYPTYPAYPAYPAYPTTFYPYPGVIF